MDDTQRSLKLKDASGLDGSIREVVGGDLALNIGGSLDFLLGKDGIKKLIPSLSYFVQTGRLPDTTVMDKIRNHPWITSKDNENIRSGKLDLVVCHNCEILHVWYKEPCQKCGHGLLPLSKASPELLDKLLSEMESLYQRKVEKDALDARYPFPAERKDHTYSCVSCGKVFSLEWGKEFGQYRVACSDRCQFKCIGRPMPNDRKWPGFVTLSPDFKGGQVFYLGVATIDKKKCECYLWKMVPGASGSFYAYYGDTEKTCLHEGCGAVSGKFSQYQKIVDRERDGEAIEESWRIVANAKESYQWHYEVEGN